MLLLQLVNQSDILPITPLLSLRVRQEFAIGFSSGLYNRVVGCWLKCDESRFSRQSSDGIHYVRRRNKEEFNPRCAVRMKNLFIDA